MDELHPLRAGRRKIASDHRKRSAQMSLSFLVEHAGLDPSVARKMRREDITLTVLQEATLAGDYAKALEYQDRLMPLHTAIFMEPGLAGAKYGLSLLGRCENEVRSPLTTVTPETGEAIRAAMVHAGVLN